MANARKKKIEEVSIWEDINSYITPQIHTSMYQEVEGNFHIWSLVERLSALVETTDIFGPTRNSRLVAQYSISGFWIGLDDYEAIIFSGSEPMTFSWVGPSWKVVDPPILSPPSSMVWTHLESKSDPKKEKNYDRVIIPQKKDKMVAKIK